MYCPSCGSEERQLSQFCRACGTDLRAVRSTVERPDAITASAVTAREQIGMAVADKIREMGTVRDLKKFAEGTLPQFEKFLESPEERRLRRVRAGVISAAIGLGGTIISTIAVLSSKDIPVTVITPGLVLFFIGIGFIINGLLFSVPSKQLPGDSYDALSQELLDSDSTRPYEAPQVIASTNELGPRARPPLSSITDHTTHHLKSNKP